MDFDLLVFDLDNTLLKTNALDRFRGSENTGPRDAAYITALRTEAAASVGPIYPLAFFMALRAAHPQLALAVFTRSPRCYVETLLAEFYPGFVWDQIVAFEDVAQTKPHPEGIYRIAQATGHTNPARVAFILATTRATSKPPIMREYGQSARKPHGRRNSPRPSTGPSSACPMPG